MNWHVSQALVILECRAHVFDYKHLIKQQSAAPGNLGAQMPSQCLMIIIISLDRSIFNRQ